MADNGTNGAAPGIKWQGLQHRSDHSYDVVVVGAGGAGAAGDTRHGRAGTQDGLHHQSLPDPLPHGGGAGRASPPRCRTWARTAGSGTCTTPSRGRTGWATSTRWSIWRVKRRPPSTSSSITALPFSRTEDGKIYQRPFGGHMQNFGAGPPRPAHLCCRPTAPATPSCNTLYGQSVKHNAQFFVEYFALDLIMSDDGVCTGVVGLEPRRRYDASFRGQRWFVLATGGYGRAYFSCTSAHTCTGDGNGMIASGGPAAPGHGSSCSLHPTGIYGAGCLITEGRARRGRLIWSIRKASDFMERYAPVRQGSGVARRSSRAA